MASPGRLGRRRRPDAFGDPLGEAAEHPQWEPLPRGAVGGVGEVPSAEVDDVRAGGVPVEDLQEEQIDGGHRVENPLAPGVFLLLASPLDGVGRKFVGEVLLETPQDSDDTQRHGRDPSGSGWLCCTTRLPGAPPVLKMLQIVQVEGFVH